MATARDVVKWALRKATVTAPGEDPSSEEMTDGLESLNDMLGAWTINGLDLSLTLPLAAGDTLDTEDAYLRAIKYALAVELADEYGATLPLKVYQQADMEERNLRAALFTMEDLTFEYGLQPLHLYGDGWND